jgi:hypothetical protein
MRNKRKNGASNTKNVKNSIGNKHIFFSNSSTGTKGCGGSSSYGGKLKSPEALARLKKVKDVMAQKSKFINAGEFAGKGRTLEILDVDPEVKGKFGPVVQLKVRDPKSNMEKIWNCSSVRALRAVIPLLEKGITLIHVWTTGTGMHTMYNAKDAGGRGHQQQGSKVMRKGIRK